MRLFAGCLSTFAAIFCGMRFICDAKQAAITATICGVSLAAVVGWAEITLWVCGLLDDLEGMV